MSISRQHDTWVAVGPDQIVAHMEDVLMKEFWEILSKYNLHHILALTLECLIKHRLFLPPEPWHMYLGNLSRNQAQREHEETARPHIGRAAGRRSHEDDPNDRWISTLEDGAAARVRRGGVGGDRRLRRRLELQLGFAEEAFVEAKGQGGGRNRNYGLPRRLAEAEGRDGGRNQMMQRWRLEDRE
uniref:Uncharacterized protein n=1 Tax=Aegilops tauschii subsp. strangulata TaxID=200361 RepID=A0A453KDG4_AEGTS